MGWVDPFGLAAHRGRIQAQGKKLEQSVNWNQDEPLTAADAKLKMEKLKEKLSRTDMKIREGAFGKAERFIDDACRCGGGSAPVSKTFMAKDTPHERVDIEVTSDTALTEK